MQKKFGIKTIDNQAWFVGGYIQAVLKATFRGGYIPYGATVKVTDYHVHGLTPTFRLPKMELYLVCNGLNAGG